MDADEYIDRLGSIIRNNDISDEDKYLFLRDMSSVLIMNCNNGRLTESDIEVGIEDLSTYLYEVLFVNKIKIYNDLNSFIQKEAAMSIWRLYRHYKSYGITVCRLYEISKNEESIEEKGFIDSINKECISRVDKVIESVMEHSRYIRGTYRYTNVKMSIYLSVLSGRLLPFRLSDEDYGYFRVIMTQVIDKINGLAGMEVTEYYG